MKRTMTTILAVLMLVAPVGGEDSLRIEVGGFQMGPLSYPPTNIEGKGALAPEAASLGREELARRDRSLLQAYKDLDYPSFGRAALVPAPVVGVAPTQSCCQTRVQPVCGHNCRGPRMSTGCGENCRGMAYGRSNSRCNSNYRGMSGRYYCNCQGHIAYCQTNGLNWQTTPCCCSR